MAAGFEGEIRATNECEEPLDTGKCREVRSLLWLPGEDVVLPTP